MLDASSMKLYWLKCCKSAQVIQSNLQIIFGILAYILLNSDYLLIYIVLQRKENGHSKRKCSVLLPLSSSFSNQSIPLPILPLRSSQSNYTLCFLYTLVFLSSLQPYISLGNCVISLILLFNVAGALPPSAVPF